MSHRSSGWVGWHEQYDDPASGLVQRLSVVQRRLAEAVTAAPEGSIRLISACAGEGRDVIGGLTGHERAADVTGLLLELDEQIAAVAEQGLLRAGLRALQVERGDAATTDRYAGAVPADVLLLCGIFGNVSEADVENTIVHAPMLCAPEATVIWTRHRRPPDLTPAIRGWFNDAGFSEVAFDSPGEGRFAVGTHRLAANPLPFQPGKRLFTFV